MAIVDPELERHRQAWIGFTRLMRWALAGVIIARICVRQIGGQTGDVLGAFEQVGEAIVLLIAASLF